MSDESQDLIAQAMSKGEFHKDSKTWNAVPPSGPATERWRNWHHMFGTPHPASYVDIDLLAEHIPDEHQKFIDDDHVFWWACEDPYHDGIIVYVVCPWCSRCKLRAGFTKLEDSNPNQKDA